MRRSRRSVLAGIAASIPGPAYARLLGRGGSTSGGVAPTLINAHTVANTSGSATPTPLPVQIGQWFVPGAVPSGTYVYPAISGSTALATWQADNRVYWGDGSLKGAVYRFLLPSGIAGSGTQQISFYRASGSFSNTSAITVSDLTSGSNYNVALANLHTAFIGTVGAFISDHIQMGLTIGGGAITGGVVQFNDIVGAKTFAVAGGNGASGSISVNGTVVTVLVPGTGYALEGTNGAFKASFNTAVSNNTNVRQYAKGPTCDAFRAIMNCIDSTSNTVLPHMLAIFYVERWKDAGGSLLAFRATCHMSNATYDTTKSLNNNTYDLDWKTGSTVIRGATNADPGYTTICQFEMSGFRTLDTKGQMDWSANDTAYKAVISQRTATESNQLQATGLMLPMLPITPTVTTPTVAVPYTIGNDELTNLPLIQPMSLSGIRTPLGSGGVGHNEGLLADHAILHHMYSRAGDPTSARAWLRCVRGTAAEWSTTPNGNPMLEPSTFYMMNTVPNATQAFSGMTPTRENAFWTSMTEGGYVNLLSTGGGALVQGMTPYHIGCYEPYAYMLEGEQWMLDSLVWTAGNFCGDTLNDEGYPRQVTFGGTTYYNICTMYRDVRLMAWTMRTTGYAAALMPTLWADGTTNIEQAYIDYQIKINFDMINALVPFTGTVTLASTNRTKSFDWSVGGIFTTRALNDVGNECFQSFMDEYVASVPATMAYLLQGTSSGASIATFRDYFKLSFVGRWAYTGSHFWNDAYRLSNLQTQAGPAVTSWSGYGDVSAPMNGIMVMPVGTFTSSDQSCELSFTSGVANIAVVESFTSTPAAMMADWSGAIFADGSRIQLTVTENAGGSGTVVVPTPFVNGTWYYMKTISNIAGAQIIGLYSDAGLTTRITPTQTVANGAFWGIPANTPPADNSGAGTYNNSNSNNGFVRIAQILGTLRLNQAYGVDDSGVNLTNAIAHAKAISDAISVDYAGEPLYAQTNSLT